MTAAPKHPFLAGLHALVHLAKMTDAKVSSGYMDEVDVVSQRVWDSRWPAIEAEIVSVTTRDQLDQVLTSGASDIWGEPLTDEDEDDLIKLSVDTYDHGVTMGMRPKKKQRGFRVVRATIDPADHLGTVMDKAMTVRDRKAIDWLAGDTMFWVGDQWNQGIGTQVSNSAIAAFERGERKGDLAAELGKSMARFDKPDSYWRVVSNASIVRGRSMGQISGFRGAGTTSMEFIAMMDERTCFPAGTRVTMADGSTAPIEAIGEGDRVLSCRGRPRRVMTCWRRVMDRWVTMVFRGGRSVRMTPEHPVLTSGGWIPAGELEAGDAVARGRGTDLPDLWERGRRSQRRGLQSSLWLRGAAAAIDGDEGLRLVRRNVLGPARSGGSVPALLMGLQPRVQAPWHVGRGTDAHLRCLRSALSHQASGGRQASALFDGLQASADPLLRGMRAAGGPGKQALLLGGLLPQPHGPHLAGVAGAGHAAGCWIPARAGGQGGPLVHRHRAPRQGGDRAGRRLLACEDGGQGCEQDTAARGAWVDGAALRRARGHGEPADARRLGLEPRPVARPQASWAVVDRVVVDGREEPAYDLQVAEDHGYIAGGLVVHNSPICEDMNGRVFTIEQATSFVDNVTDTDSPDAMKDAWPWSRPSDIIGKSTSDLAAMGVVAPPLHGR